MMNHIRQSGAPAIACLVSTTLYQNFASSRSSEITRRDQNKLHQLQRDEKKQGLQFSTNNTLVSYCEAKANHIGEATSIHTDDSLMGKQTVQPNGQEHEELKGNGQNSLDAGEMKKEKEEEGPMFHNLFPQRQLWNPKLEYPLWDEDWDGRKMKGTGDEAKDLDMKRSIRKKGVTRHIILIRHGQYDEQHKEDEKRILTPLGRKQAELTGQRLAKMLEGFDEKFGPCNIKTIRVSNMARAKETADIIAQSLPETIHRAEPDANLNEGRPCHHIPGGKASSRAVKKTDEGHGRIETAFTTYFYRAEPPTMEQSDENNGEVQNKQTVFATSNENKGDDGKVDLKPHPQHEFEIIVCHANVIRYFLCRALQIPPEAWLRLCTFNCSLTYLTVRPTGTVSCRMLGDIGHLGYEHSTFSMHHGFNW